MLTRDVVSIDEDRCDGCGLCVSACEEGAIKLIDGKARLVGDIYCDGLGACLGHCPKGAISIVERPAEEFDEAAVAKLVAASQPKPPVARHGLPTLSVLESQFGGGWGGGGCPGAASRQLRPAPASASLAADAGNGAVALSQTEPASRLTNWPVQLHLVPPHAPYLKGADLLLAADCVPFAYADFHNKLLQDRPVLIGCPKLDDGQFYTQKLAAIIAAAGVKSVTVARMEVPCCSGLCRIAHAAAALAGGDVPVREAVITIDGVLNAE